MIMSSKQIGKEKLSVMVDHILGRKAHPRVRHVGRAEETNPRSRRKWTKAIRGKKKTRRR